MIGLAEPEVARPDVSIPSPCVTTVQRDGAPHQGDVQAPLVLPAMTALTQEVSAVEKLSAMFANKPSLRHKRTQCTGQESILSYLCVLQTAEATRLASQLSTGQVSYSKPIPVQLMQMGVSLPPPPCTHFHKLSSEQVQELEQLTRPFDGVAQAKTETDILLQPPGSAQLRTSKPGQHILLYPKARYLEHTLQLYNQLKCASQSTSAVLVVPANLVSSPLLKSWHVIKWITKPQPGHTWSFKHAVLVEMTQQGNPESQDSPVMLFQSQKHSMSVTATIAGTVVPVLLDSGATGTGFISKAYVQELGLPISQQVNTQLVKLGDTHTTQSCGLCTVPLRIGKYKAKIQCLVMPALPQYALVLGDPWLTAVKADLNYGRGTVTIYTTQGAVVTLHTKTAVPQPVPQCLVQDTPALLDSEPEHLLPIQDFSAAKLEGPVVRGKKVAKWVQKNQVEYCYMALISEALEEPSTLCALDTITVEDKWTQAVPQSDPVSLQMRALLMGKQHLFKEELTQLPPVRLNREVIPLVPGTSVPNRPLFRYSQTEIEEMKKQVTELLSKGLLNPSSSPFGAPVLFVKKKDGTLRMCIDYRGLNNITVPNRYPLPRVDDLLDRLQGATVFSSLDLLSGYHQIRLVESDVPKTAFKTPFGLFEFKVMPFGLTNAPAVFMAHMNDVLSHLPFCVVYLDDILIYSKTPEEHVEHVKQVLDILDQHQYLLKLKKCDFFKKELLYLGHVISADGIKPDPKKVEAILNYPTPHSVQSLRSFMGLVNWFHRSIKDLAKLASPLTDLLSGPNVSRRKSASTDITEKWQRNPACQQAFEAVKHALATAATLKLPDLNQPFQLITDASDFSLGAILVQDGRPVAFESRKMTPAQRNYHTTDKELLAVVHALKLWRCYLSGAKFEILTDHKPLTYLKTQPLLSPRQARWSEFLSDFFVDWHYVPGLQNPSDGLSRLSGGGEAPKPVVLNMILTRSQVNKLAAKPSDQTAKVSRNRKQPVRAVLEPLAQPQKGESLSQLVSVLELVQGYTQDKFFQVTQNLVDLKRDEQGVYWKDGKVVVPQSEQLRWKILHSCHSSLSAGHFGVTKTLDLVSRLFWWPGIRKSVKNFVQTCDSCQRVKASNQHPAGLLHPLPIPERRWATVTMDFIVDLPITDNGQNAILVFCDKLTKMGHFVPCKTTCDAVEASELFLEHVYRLHGMPEVMVHDRGPQFSSQFWRHFYSECGVKQAFSSAYHPETDGQTERLNRILEDYLRHYVNQYQDDWHKFLKFAEFAYNNAKQESLGISPFRLNYGFDPITPVQSLAEPFQLKQQRVLEKAICPEAVQRFEATLHQALNCAKEHLQVAQQRQKQYADTKRRHVQFKAGDKVLLCTKNMKLKASGSRKLLPRFVGPFTIKRVVNPVAYELDLPSTLKVYPVFHIALLREYKEDPNHLYRAPPLPEVIEGQLEYEVEKILDHRKMGNTHVYKIRWLGYGPSSDTWEPEANLKNCPTILHEYQKTMTDK